jgi:CHASE2 domain-containing sensor protein
MNAFKHIAIGLAATALLLLAKIGLEHTALGRSCELTAFEWLQGFLPDLSPDRLPIIVDDINKIPGGKDQPTPRDQLEPLLEAIADKRPKAIAVDVDFSPDEAGWKTPQDPAFFDFCIKLTREQGIPVVLAVYRKRDSIPAAWLGSSEYQELAAAGVAKADDTTRLFRWVPTDSDQARLPTMGEALARTYRGRPEPPSWIAWALEGVDKSADDVGEESQGSLRLVNYSKLEQLKRETLEFSRPETVKDGGNSFKGRMVILGDVAFATDTFNVPGQSRPVPGVYLMALAAYTLAVEPLYEFTYPVRLGIDFAISVVIVFGAYRISRRKISFVKQRKQRGRFVLVAVAAAVVAGIALVRFGHIMWFDFILAPFAMMLHPRVEDWISARFSGKSKASKKHA